MGILDFNTKNSAITLDGFDDMTALMKGLPNRVSKTVVRQSLMAAVTPVLKAMRANAPVRVPEAGKTGFREYGKLVSAGAGERRYPGNLKKSIIKRTLKSRGATETPIVVVGTNMSKKKSKWIGWYGRLVEFGTKNSKAYPFARPAYDANYRQVFINLRDEIKTRLPVAIAKLKAKGKR